jgi:Siphovirus-type tail component, C-terminal domain
MRTWILKLGDTTLDLVEDYNSSGLFFTSKEVGAPTVRENTEDFPSQDGYMDRTQFFGSRVIDLQGVAFPPRSESFDKFSPFLNPKARCELMYARDEDDDILLFTGLRVAQWERTADSPTTFGFQIQWKADPVALSYEEYSDQIAVYYSPIVGRNYARNYPITYPAGGSPGIGTIHSDGTYETWPIYRMFGPVTNPGIDLIGPVSGVVIGRIVFTGITVIEGDYLEINTKLRTVMLNGISSRYNFVDFGNTIWTPLQPGDNQILYYGDDSAAPAFVEIVWQDAFL